MNRRKALRLSVTGLGTIIIAGCAAQAAKLNTNLNTALNTAATDTTTAVAQVPVTAAQAVSLYGIAKGLGEIALAVLAVNPATATEADAITAAIGIGDQVVKDLPTIADNVVALGAAVSKLLTQVNILNLNGAPVITVVANQG